MDQSHLLLLSFIIGWATAPMFVALIIAPIKYMDAIFILFTGTFKIFEDSDLGSYHSGFTVGNLTEDIVYTLPLADAGTSGDALTSNASGVLSWTTMSGGTSWQAVDTTGFTAVAGEGYFCNTTSAAFTATLPASPSLGDECTFVDYAGTFDTNNLTVGRNSEKINGSAADLTVSVDRAAFTLVYTDSTQGWLLKDK